MFDVLRKQPKRWVWGVAIAFFSITLLLTLHRYFTYYSSYDQGIFNQVFWNGARGRFFQSSLSSQLSTNVVNAGEIPNVAYHRLGQHFTPALLLWLPIYSIFQSPVTLSVLQVTLITAAGLVLYKLARCHIEPGPAAALTTAYFGANAIVGPTIGNFHDICQIPLFVFSLLLGLEKRWWWLYGTMAILLPLVREDSGIVLFSIGFYLVVSRRHPWLGAGLCGYSLAYILLLTNWGMPQFSADVSDRFMIERFGQYIDDESASTLDVLLAMLTQPWIVARELLTPFDRTLRYLLGQWLPFMFIPAIAPESWLVAGFPLLKLLIAKGESVLAINIRYAMSIVPGLAYGAIFWWKRHPNAFKKLRLRRFWGFCILLSLFFTVTSNPNRTLSFVIPDAINPTVYVPLLRQWEHAGEIRQILAEIPEKSSVSATTYLIPHLSNRRELVRFPMSFQLRDEAGEVVEVDYAVGDLWQMREYSPVFRGDRDLLARSFRRIDETLEQGDYGIQRFEDGVILLQRGVASTPEALAQWQDFRQASLAETPELLSYSMDPAIGGLIASESPVSSVIQRKGILRPIHPHNPGGISGGTSEGAQTVAPSLVTSRTETPRKAIDAVLPPDRSVGSNSFGEVSPGFISDPS